MISVIIPNWNGVKYLEVCLGSLEKQTFREFEVILIDNHSTDDSVRLVKQHFPIVQVVVLKRNRGFAGAANEGIRIARGEYIALLNNDTEADPRWLEELLRGISKSQEVGLCASKIIQFDDRSKLDTAGDGYTKFGVSIKRGHRHPQEEYSHEEFVFGSCGAAALYRKSIFDEIGYFDEDFFCIYEDVDLSFRAQLAGYRCLYVPKAVVYHRVGGTAGTNNDFTVYYGQRNLEAVFLKNMPFPLFVKYLPLHAGYVVLALIYNCFRKNGGIFLRSKMDAFKYIRLMLRKRKAIQCKRKASIDYLETILDRYSYFQHVTGVF